jgi:hypothetical protein
MHEIRTMETHMNMRVTTNRLHIRIRWPAMYPNSQKQRYVTVQSGIGAGFLRVLGLLLSILIPSNIPY